MLPVLCFTGWLVVMLWSLPGDLTQLLLTGSLEPVSFCCWQGDLNYSIVVVDRVNRISLLSTGWLEAVPVGDAQGQQQPQREPSAADARPEDDHVQSDRSGSRVPLQPTLRPPRRRNAQHPIVVTSRPQAVDAVSVSRHLRQRVLPVQPAAHPAALDGPGGRVGGRLLDQERRLVVRGVHVGGVHPRRLALRGAGRRGRLEGVAATAGRWSSDAVRLPPRGRPACATMHVRESRRATVV